MKRFKSLIVYNCCQLIAIICSLNVLQITQSNPSQHLPQVLAISYGIQCIALLVIHLFISNIYQTFNDFNVLSKIICLFKSIAIYYVLVVLLGAPILAQKLNTLYLSVLLTSMTTLPTIVLCKNHSITNLFNCLNNFKIEARVDNMIVRTSLVTLIGAWFGAFPLVLDWMQPWQEWPVSVCLGAIFANLMANLVSLGLIGYKMSPKLK